MLEQLPGPGGPPAGSPGGGRRSGALRGRSGRFAPHLGDHGPPPPARGATGELHRLRGGSPIRVGISGEHGGDRLPRRPRAGGVLGRAEPRQHHRRLPDLARRLLRLPSRGPRAPRVGAHAGLRARRSGRHGRDVLDGRRCRAHRRDPRPRESIRLPGHGGRGARHGGDRPRGPRRRG